MGAVGLDERVAERELCRPTPVLVGRRLCGASGTPELDADGGCTARRVDGHGFAEGDGHADFLALRPAPVGARAAQRRFPLDVWRVHRLLAPARRARPDEHVGRVRELNAQAPLRSQRLIVAIGLEQLDDERTSSPLIHRQGEGALDIARRRAVPDELAKSRAPGDVVKVAGDFASLSDPNRVGRVAGSQDERPRCAPSKGRVEPGEVVQAAHPDPVGHAGVLIRTQRRLRAAVGKLKRHLDVVPVRTAGRRQQDALPGRARADGVEKGSVFVEGRHPAHLGSVGDARHELVEGVAARGRVHPCRDTVREVIPPLLCREGGSSGVCAHVVGLARTRRCLPSHPQEARRPRRCVQLDAAWRGLCLDRRREQRRQNDEERTREVTHPRRELAQSRLVPPRSVLVGAPACGKPFGRVLHVVLQPDPA